MHRIPISGVVILAGEEEHRFSTISEILASKASPAFHPSRDWKKGHYRIRFLLPDLNEPVIRQRTPHSGARHARK